MTANFESCPAIDAILYRYSPTRKHGRRAIRIERPNSVDLEEIEDVARELQLPEVMAQLDAAEVATLAAAAATSQERYGHDAGASIALQALLTSRPGELDADIALVAITGHGLHRDILKVFPEIAKSAAMIEAIIEAASQGSLAGWHRNVDVNVLVIRDPLAEIVTKAEGAEGRRPRPLARFGTVEIALRVSDIKPRGG